MLASVAEDIRDCLAHAEKCRELAARAHTPEHREGFLDMERRWLRLARSYEFTAALGIFEGK